MFTFSRFFSKQSGTRTRNTGRGKSRKGRRGALALENLEARTTPTASVFTDLLDYQPGATAYITAEDFEPGSTVEFQVLHVSGNNGGQGHLPWRVTDGSEEDLDHTVNGVIQTSWYVNPDDSLGETFVLTALGNGADRSFGTGDDEKASTTFTDANPAVTLNQWETLTLKWANGQANANQARYLEGDTVPFAAKFSNLVAGYDYGFVINLNTYQQNTNAGGFLYLDNYTRSVTPASNAFGSITPSTDPAVANDVNYPSQAGEEASAFSSTGADVYRVDITNSGTGNLNRVATVRFTAAASTAVIYWGQRLSLPGEVNYASGQYAPSGASGFTGGSLQTKIEGGSNSGVVWITPSNAVQLMPGVVVQGSIEGVKWNDLDADGVKEAGEPLLSGWTIRLYTDSNPNGVFDPGDSLVATQVTDSNGAYKFNPVVRGTYFVQEVGQAGWEQTFPDPADTTYPNANGVWGPLLVDELTPNHTGIDFGNFLADIRIDIDKVTEDGPAKGDGLTILSGEPIHWVYTVTNPGNVALSGVSVTDNMPGVSPAYASGDTDGDSMLDPTETWIFRASGTSILGSYSNTGTVQGYYATPVNTVSASDASDYVGVTPVIRVNKVTVDAGASGDGLLILSGESIQWRYDVTNPGTRPLSDVVVTDSQAGVNPVYVSGDSNGDGRLDLTENWVYLASGTSVAGPYSNTGTATGRISDSAGHIRSASASDDSWYFGADPRISIDKVTVDDGVSGDGLTILSGETIRWVYTVTNTGNVPLFGVGVTDSEAGVIPAFVGGDTDGDGWLDQTETWVYEASGTSVEGPYRNTGTARGLIRDSAGHSRTASDADDSGYFGANPRISIDKVTVDGGARGDGLTILSGEPIQWVYTVTNTGNMPLAGVTVTDSVPGVLPAYVSGDADSDGLLDLAETWVYEASGTSVEGPYSNIGTARGLIRDSAGHARMTEDEDRSGYFGADPRISIDKETVDDGVSGDGLVILSGEPIRWVYTVTNIGNVPLAGVTVTDSMPGVLPMYVSGDADSDGLLDLTETWIFGAGGMSIAGRYDNTGFATGGYADTAGHVRGTRASDDSWYFGADPRISIDKVTVDDTARGDGLTILSGETIQWVYTVTNTGNVPLAGVTVTDNMPGVVPVYQGGDANGNSLLDLSETWIYQAEGVSEEGPYRNIGRARGLIRDSAGHARMAEDEDDSGYFGANPQISIDKVTVDDTVRGDGLTILSGETIQWVYTVTNTGNVPLAGVTVTDNMPGVVPVYQGGDANGNSLLDLSETWIYQAGGVSEEGPYRNIGTARGLIRDSAGHARMSEDEDGSGYFGANPQVSIDKVTVDGGAHGDGLTILSGESIQWVYTVTNTGNVPLAGVTVTDSVPGVLPAYVSGDTDSDGMLDLTETWIYEASGVSVAGPYRNTGIVTGSFADSAGHVRRAGDTDDSGYLGAAPRIRIDKVTEDDTARGDGLTILSDEQIRWVYTVTNTGNVPLAGVMVTDNMPGVVPVYQGGDTDSDGMLDQTETWVYEANGTSVAGDYSNTGTATGSFADTAGHTRVARASDDSFYFGADPRISIDKVTVDDGVSGDGLLILSGEPIRWVYTVTNIGNVPLAGVTVTDSVPGVLPVYVSGDADSDGLLDLTETWIFGAGGMSIAGRYDNTGFATGGYADTAGHVRGTRASDDSWYFGADPRISIDKVTVDVTARGDGLTILSGETIQWVYTVTNTGNVPLAGVTVTDNMPGVVPVYQGGDSDSDGLLDLTETWVYQASGTSILGAYSNTGTASGSITDDAGHRRTETASDRSSYVGVTPLIAIDKVTVYGGNEGDGLRIPAGESLAWKYSVTNADTVPLADVRVRDDNGTPADLADDFFANYQSGDDGDGLLEVGEVWVFEYSGFSSGGSYTNVGTASGSFTDDAGHSRTASASDSSSYVGELQFTTFTLGGWGSTPQGNNPGTYLQAHFGQPYDYNGNGTMRDDAIAFQYGLVVPRPDTTTVIRNKKTGEVTTTNLSNDILLSTADDVRSFLRSTNKSTFSGNTVDGTSVNGYRPSTLEKQYVALVLNVTFDDLDPSFGGSSTHLGDLKVYGVSGVADDTSIRTILNQAAAFLNGDMTAYTLGLSAGDLTMLLGLLNESFDGGHESDWAMHHLR